MDYKVYILYSEKLDRYYKGQTIDLTDRLKRHNAGLENYTAAGRPWKLVWHTTKRTRAEAMLLERKLKNLSRSKLQAFLRKYPQN